jgi:hypothetical protein
MSNWLYIKLIIDRLRAAFDEEDEYMQELRELQKRLEEL